MEIKRFYEHAQPAYFRHGRARLGNARFKLGEKMLLTIRIKIRGKKPLLINTFPLDTFAEGKSKEGKAGKNENEWKNTVLMNADRNLYIFPSYILGSIRDGGKHVKIGKSSLSKKMGGCLECLEDIILVKDRKVPQEKNLTTLVTDDVYLDVRSVVNPMTKGRNLRYRIATKAGWEIETKIQFDDSAFSKEQLKDCIKCAGLFEGIGDGRKIGFGKFELLDFEIV